MRAAWFWIDRWRQSSAYTDLSAEAQGVFRNLLDELWLRDGAIPDNDKILAKACGDYEAWPRVKKEVLSRFYLTPEGWRNKTHDEVSKESRRRADKQASFRAKRGNAVGNADGNVSGYKDGYNSHSPSPSPSKDKSMSKDQERDRDSAASTALSLPNGAAALVQTSKGELVTDPFQEKPGDHDRAVRELIDLCTQIANREGKEAREVLFEASRTPRGITMTNPAAASLDWICQTIGRLKVKGDPLKPYVSDRTQSTRAAIDRVLGTNIGEAK